MPKTKAHRLAKPPRSGRKAEGTRAERVSVALPIGAARDTRGARGRPNRVKGRPKFWERILKQHFKKPFPIKKKHAFRIILKFPIKIGKNEV